jgi:hypothetical protein
MVLADLADRHGLRLTSGESAAGLPEAYVYSPDMTYRYAFARWWGSPEPQTTMVWVLLNPATGDTEKRHRPTLDRCIMRSQPQFTGLVIINLFAFRHTDPRQLKKVIDPVGPANNACLRVLTAAGPQTVVAWGSKGRLRRRSAAVSSLLRDPLCLGLTRTGEPRHPLYVRADAPLTPWHPPAPAPTPLD